MSHIVTRECDEYACSCGMRWGIDDCDPHGDRRKVSAEEYANILNSCKHFVKLPGSVTPRKQIIGIDLAEPGADRTVEATYENGKLRLDSIRELIKD